MTVDRRRSIIRETSLVALALVTIAPPGSFLIAPLGAQETPTGETVAIPTYEVRRAPSRLVIDGTMDEAAWEHASPAVTLQFLWEEQTGARHETRVRLLWDDDHLYVGYECEDSDITAHYLERDDPTYRDDAVEIFINPLPDQTGAYIGLEMNARAVLYDYLMYDARYLFKRLDLDGVQVASHLNGTLNTRGDRDDGWSLEVAIPWINFEGFAERPSDGTVWKANLNRWDGVAPDRSMSIWSDPLQEQPRPHVPERFGDLVFRDD